MFASQQEQVSGDGCPEGQLSGPFKNMCLASQQKSMHYKSRVPLFHEDCENMPPPSQMQAVQPSQLDGLMSQDFVTPADQFDVECDLTSQKVAGTLVRQRSPAVISPTRIKRVRNVSPKMGGQQYARPAQMAPCYRNAFSKDAEEEESMMSWTGGEVGVPVPSGSRYRDEFKETGMLGQGSFCKVYSARHKLDGKVYAIKRTLRGVRRQSPEFAQFLQEVQILSNVPYHQGIIRYYASWTEATVGHHDTENLFLQLEAGTCTLKSISMGDPLPERTLVEVARQVLCALKHLHAHGIAHMDIKPSNIIIVRKDGDEKDPMDLSPGEIKIGDFGLATNCQPLGAAAVQAMTVQEGDACYLPLEVMNSDYTQLEKADIFALGATLFELASGNELPSGGQLYDDLRRGKVPLLPTMTTSCMQMIRSMLKFDPKDRPDAEKLLSMPPFVKKSH